MQLNGHMLSMLAAPFADDPFEKVKKMIQNFIYLVMEEANAENSQESWCDVKLSNEFTEKKVDMLVNKIQENKATKAVKKQDVKYEIQEPNRTGCGEDEGVIDPRRRFYHSRALRPAGRAHIRQGQLEHGTH